MNDTKANNQKLKNEQSKKFIGIWHKMNTFIILYFLLFFYDDDFFMNYYVLVLIISS